MQIPEQSLQRRLDTCDDSLCHPGTFIYPRARAVHRCYVCIGLPAGAGSQPGAESKVIKRLCWLGGVWRANFSVPELDWHNVLLSVAVLQPQGSSTTAGPDIMYLYTNRTWSVPN